MDPQKMAAMDALRQAMLSQRQAGVMGRPDAQMGGYEQALGDAQAAHLQGIRRAAPAIMPGSQGPGPDMMMQRDMDMGRQMQALKLAQLAPTLATGAQGGAGGQPPDPRLIQQQREMQMQQEQAMGAQRNAMAGMDIQRRAPLLHRDMMRRQMGQMMQPQPQPMGARQSLINAKRGMAQGGKGGRGAIKTAMSQMSQRQMQRPAG